MKAADIMTKEFDTVLPSATIKEAVGLLRRGRRGQEEKGVNALIVVDKSGKLVGLITMSHILKAIIPFYMETAHVSEFAWEGLFERMCHKIRDKKVSELMEEKVVTIGPDMNLIEIAEIMGKNMVKRLPVVVEGRVLGIVYRKELFFKIVDTMLDKEICP